MDDGRPVRQNARGEVDLLTFVSPGRADDSAGLAATNSHLRGAFAQRLVLEMQRFRHRLIGHAPAD
jgi:hypothetical protein